MDQLLELDDKIKSLTPEQQQQMLTGIRQEAALANAQNMITMLTDKCTTKCIASPGSVLNGSEKQCLQRCMDRFVESWDVVTRTLHSRLQQEIANMPSSGSPSLMNDLSGAGSSFS
ncbi:tim10/DDP family zinc finger domain-containing protein [Ditylenchus destructor]|uniref:Mitochondrial import inner membrane translocase subunit n=1 Tax=Ditylenchus destructor TaxID=166010 RepID=A0AAD4N1U8_9BILA|nr:tim10/DDP family zinc finger domain-containing protein [Ditylenchus destructor]